MKTIFYICFFVGIVMLLAVISFWPGLSTLINGSHILLNGKNDSRSNLVFGYRYLLGIL